MRAATLVLSLLSLAAGIGSAEAAEEDPSEMAGRAIQKRLHEPHHELRLGIAYLPQDAFYKAAGPELAYTTRLSSWLSWEALRVGYFATVDTDLRREAASAFEKTADPYEKVEYMALTHLQITPLYGRSTFLNHGLLRHEMYLTTGAGVIGWKAAEVALPNGSARRPGGPAAVVDAGLGFRFQTSSRFALRLETLYQVAMRPDGSRGDQFLISVGGAFSDLRKKRNSK